MSAYLTRASAYLTRAVEAEHRSAATTLRLDLTDSIESAVVQEEKVAGHIKGKVPYPWIYEGLSKSLSRIYRGFTEGLPKS